MTNKLLALSFLAASLAFTQAAVAAPDGARPGGPDVRSPVTRDHRNHVDDRTVDRDHRPDGRIPDGWRRDRRPAPAPKPVMVAAQTARARMGTATFRLSGQDGPAALVLTADPGITVRSVVITYANGQKVTLPARLLGDSIELGAAARNIRAVKVKYRTRNARAGGQLKIFRRA